MKTKNKQFYVLGLLPILIVFLIPGCFVIDPVGTDWDNEANYTLRRGSEESVDIDGQQVLRIHGISGRISITGSDQTAQLLVTTERKVKAISASDAEHSMEYLDVEIVKGQSDIIIKTIQPSNSNGRTYTVDYQIRIPYNWKVEVTNINGEVLVDSIGNDVQIFLTNGNSTIHRHTGNLYTQLVNGNMTVQSILPDQGNWNLSIVNGQIFLSLPTSTSAELRAAITNGSIQTQNLELTDLTSTKHQTKGRLNSGEGSIDISVTNGKILIEGTESTKKFR